MLTAMVANAQTDVNAEKEAEKAAKLEAKAQAKAAKEAEKAAQAEAKAQAKEAKEAEKAAAKAAKEAEKAHVDADKAAAKAAKSEAEAQAAAEKEAAKAQAEAEKAAAKAAKAEAKGKSIDDSLVEEADSSRWRIKTNGLLWLMGNANVELEYKLAPQWSIEAEATGNVLKFAKDRQWKNFQFAAEGRYWLDEAFKGHFFGVHFNWGRYWIGRVSTPWGSFHKHFYYRGWGIRTGVTYGYNWKLSKHWDLEALVGLGLIFTNYDVWDLHETDVRTETKLNKEGTDSRMHKVTFSPTRLAVSIAYRF